MKKLLSIILSVSMLLSMATAVFADAVSETTAVAVPAPSDWAKESVKKAAELNITEASEAYYYANPITREEFCELIYSLMKAVNKKSYDINTSFRFEDTDNESVLILNRLGIINGKTETKFAPDDYLTREDAATIIVRMVNNVMPMAATEMWFAFDDMSEISDWASDSVQTICNLGFMHGVGNNNFAPKDTYTTEQAIATLVRVYESAEAAGIVAENSSSMDSSIGIIGGADEPTEIMVTDTIEIDDFYTEEAIKLITESGKLATDKSFISLYTANDEMTEKISAIGAVDFSKPTDVFYLSADRERIIANITAMIEAEGGNIEDFGNAGFEYLFRKLNFSALASMINASYGAENLAALTILTNSRGYIMPEDFENNFALFLQYEGEYSTIVSFSEYGEGVISANMSFVKNGDKDNVFRRMYEITSALGEDSIDVAMISNYINIQNAESLSYEQIEKLQKEVNNGHFPWRLDYEQVIKEFLFNEGVSVENGKITALAGGGAGISATYSVGGTEYEIDLFQPINKTDKGIWIVRTVKTNICAFVKEINDNTVVIDIAEYITTEDSERISELKLTESDMPNGYYIYNIDTETEEYLLTGNTKYNFIDWHNTFVEEGADRSYSTTNKEEFIKYINSYKNSQPGMPFFFEISDNEIISIIEKPMM